MLATSSNATRPVDGRVDGSGEPGEPFRTKRTSMYLGPRHKSGVFELPKKAFDFLVRQPDCKGDLVSGHSIPAPEPAKNGVVSGC